LKLLLRRHDSNMHHADESISAYANRHRLHNAPRITMNIDDFPETAPKTLAASDWTSLLRSPKDEIVRMLHVTRND